MTAMPILNRQPEAPYIQGLLIVLGLIMAGAAVRYFPFFLHEVFGVR
jgi:hypothetical protein